MWYTRVSHSAGPLIAVALIVAVATLPGAPGASRAAVPALNTCDAPIQTLASRGVGGEGELNDIVVTPDAAWTVGSSLHPDARFDQPLVQGRDGTGWLTADTPIFTTPGTNEGVAVLRAVGLLAAKDVWAVGYLSSATYPTWFAGEEALILRWDGATWSRMANTGALQGFSRISDIAVIAPDNVWVVGISDGRPAIARWNGSTWSASAIPGDETGGLTAVSAAGANEIWAVGILNEGFSTRLEPLLLRYDGSAWARLPAPPNTGGLFDVDTGADGAVWAVGEHYGGLVVLRWDGALFEQVAIPDSMGIPPTTIAVIADYDVWIAGTTGQGGKLMHWDGVAWEPTARASDDYQVTGYNELFDAGPGDLWAVGFVGAQGGSTLVQRLESRLSLGFPRVVQDGGGLSIAIDVALSAPAASTVRVTARTEDASAVAGRDYTAVTTRLAIPACGRAATVLVPLIPGAAPLPGGAFRVLLEQPSGAGLLTASRLVPLDALAYSVALPLASGSGVAPAGRLAYAGATGGDYENLDIYTVGVDGSEPRQLTSALGRDESPAWSPDGRRIAFISFRDANPNLYVMNADGSGQARLTNDPSLEMAPAWSPDGTQIAFIANRGGSTKFLIYLIDARGGDVRQLTPANAELPASSLSWSPDGRSIVFTSGSPTVRGLFILGLDGSLRRLTDQQDDGFPMWSPDGREIAFFGSRGRLRELFSIHPDGSGLREVNPNFDVGPASWSPDGKFLAFDPMVQGKLAITGLHGQAPTFVSIPQGSLGVPTWAPSR